MDRDQLAQLADNPLLFEAVKSAILSRFDLNIRFTEAQSAAERFELVNAISKGREYVEAAFADIARCKTIPNEKPAVMPAR